MKLQLVELLYQPMTSAESLIPRAVEPQLATMARSIKPPPCVQVMAWSVELTFAQPAISPAELMALPPLCWPLGKIPISSRPPFLVQKKP